MVTYYDTGSKLGYMKATTSYALSMIKKLKKNISDYLKEIIRVISFLVMP
jgi:UTP-glucose-1-phosphate uridylyltransferase